ncbi:MAG TPA: ATP-binding protein [Rhodocyclaceae bacterium]|nr:ATP-binding protein [Rhodocyclaceae bacterium]
MANEDTANKGLASALENHQLQVSHRRLSLLLVLPLFIIVCALAAMQYREYHAHLLETLIESDRSVAYALDGVAKQASDHVLRMQLRMQGLLANPPTYQDASRQYFGQRTAPSATDGYALDALPAARREAMGQAFWAGAGKAFPRERLVEIDQAREFFEMVALTHRTTPLFEWSYYLAATRDLLVLYPWVTSHNMVEAQGHMNMRAALSSYFNYDIYLDGMPARNPRHSPYWVTPYIDAFGTGAMVSHGAPVYVDGTFRGIVGTDFRLATLQQFLEKWPAIGRRLIVDDKGYVLADTNGIGPDHILRISDLGIAGLSSDVVARAMQLKGKPRAQSGQFVSVNSVEYAPWRLVHLVPDASLYKLIWPRVIPYAFILAALGVAFLLSLLVLRRLFIAPALRLVDYLQRASRDALAPAPDVPARWRPCVDIARNVFTANHDAVRQLKAGESFKAAIIENAMLAVVSVDRQGIIREFNRAAENTFGHAQQEAVGKDLADLIIPQRYRAAHRAGMVRHIETRASNIIGGRLQLEALHADGHELPIELTIFVTPVGEQEFYTAFIADLTQKRLAEQEVARQREALRQSEKLSAMGALLAGVAHELNNPLAILMGRAALLEGKAKDPAVRDDAARIHAAADRCGRIVRTFLSMARQKPVQRKPAQLNDVVTGAVELFAYSLRSSGIELDLQLDHSLSPIYMDADQVGQVIVNLIVNAQQALVIQDGERMLRIATARHGNAQILRVSDNGPGIPAALRDRIFEPFFTTKSEGTGTGIGLSVSRAIMREHGGEIVLEAETTGASFLLNLPTDRAGRAAPVIPPASTGAGEAEGIVLVVDDEMEVGAVLADILRSAGYAVTLMTSGKDALAWLDKHACDMIFSDVRMPDMDGITLWRTIRERWPALVGHMAFVTGDTLSARIAPLLEETQCPCLEKPFLPEDVLMLAARIEAPR